MQGQLLFAIIIAVFVLLFLWVAIAALNKSRQRRREQFKETSEEELESRAAEATLLRESAEAAKVPEGEAAPGEEQEAEEREEPEQEPEAALKEEARLAAEEQVGGPQKKEDEALKVGMSRTSRSLRERFGQVFGRHPKVDPAALDELEEALLLADVGVALTGRLIGGLRTELGSGKFLSKSDVEGTLRRRMLETLAESGSPSDPLAASGSKPRVILFVGVNGVGKTTTIGKIASLLRSRGHQVVLAAGDTFRAAAVDQLAVWAERTDSRLIRGEEGADPASVVFNGIEHAVQTGADVLLADTAGRLHTKTALMDEIKKVKRSASKARDAAPDETWLVVDATTGQNALQQAREFHQALGLTGIILTKLDGTAKGGVVLAIADALRLPVRFVGVGERPEDLRPFDPQTFVSALFMS